MFAEIFPSRGRSVIDKDRHRKVLYNCTFDAREKNPIRETSSTEKQFVRAGESLEKAQGADGVLGQTGKRRSRGGKPLSGSDMKTRTCTITRWQTL